MPLEGRGGPSVREDPGKVTGFPGTEDPTPTGDLGEKTFFGKAWPF